MLTAQCIGLWGVRGKVQWYPTSRERTSEMWAHPALLGGSSRPDFRRHSTYGLKAVPFTAALQSGPDTKHQIGASRRTYCRGSSNSRFFWCINETTTLAVCSVFH